MLHPRKACDEQNLQLNFFYFDNIQTPPQAEKKFQKPKFSAQNATLTLFKARGEEKRPPTFFFFFFFLEKSLGLTLLETL